MRRNKISIICAIVLFFSWSVSAQDSVLVKEITVSQEYSPTVSEAFKLGLSPEVETPESYNPVFEYSFFNAPLRTKYNIQHIKAKICEPQEQEYDSKKNYIKAGLGNYNTVLGELYYNAYSSDIQNVNIFYGNRSSWGKVRLQDESKVDAPLFLNQGKIDIQRRYRRSVLSSSIIFDRMGYKYYGYNTLEDNVVYRHSDNSALVTDSAKKAIMDLGLELNLSSLSSRSGDAHYSSTLSFHSISNDDKFVDNVIAFDLELLKAVQKVSLGLNFNADLGLCSASDSAHLRPYTDDTYFGAAIAPFVMFEKKNWDLKIGAQFDYFYRGFTEEINVSPVLDFNFNIVPKYFMAYVKGEGGIKQNTYASLIKDNPYMANDIDLKPTRIPVDVDAGIIGHPTKELSLNFGVGYQWILDQLFYVNEFVEDGSNAVNVEKYTNRFQAEYDDNHCIAFHGEVNYDTYDKWSATLRADYYSYNLAKLSEAWNLPEFKIQALGRYRVTEKLSTNLRFLFLPERAVKVSSNNDVDYLPVVYDLTLGANYQYLDNLSFYIDVNNALASKYYQYNGYASQRFNAVAGAVFRF